MTKVKFSWRMLFVVCWALLVVGGCNADSASQTKSTSIKNAIAEKEVSSVIMLHPDIKSLTNDFRSFWQYWYDSVDLSRDFIPLDLDHKQISKSAFLKKLNTGKYLPVIIQIHIEQYTYQLKPLPKNAARNIASTIKQMTTEAIFRLEQEGSELPKFSFKALDGQTYTNENCKGKILVLNTWYIRCGACKAEMPDLNGLVAQYQNRNDIVFLGLCTDPWEPVKEFMRKTKFDYLVVPDANDYVDNLLPFQGFPTQVLVDKQGKIVKIMSTYKSLKRELAKLADS